MMDADERAEFDELLEAAEENAETEWEYEFIDSIKKQAENPFFSPSDAQWEKLKQIAIGEVKLGQRGI